MIKIHGWILQSKINKDFFWKNKIYVRKKYAENMLKKEWVNEYFELKKIIATLEDIPIEIKGGVKDEKS